MCLTTRQSAREGYKVEGKKEENDKKDGYEKIRNTWRNGTGVHIDLL